ncbi:hypothetical protein BDW02DRAFT_584410 [Decorospora gaudefroyi]|uniref:Uncharacterized protein n=1 Tax=Decorospora gaudefroyi TaxID=184978 RepID=A0A6A5K266_9PLEO|nr:hypothetical protein BDW02DRAFT_584410 [Decorospora gaudefroyi]
MNVNMPGSHSYHHAPSESREFDDIIDFYKTPASSSSPPMCIRQPYDASPQDDRHTVMSMSSSPPPYTPSSMPKQSNPYHQRSMAHSGYLARDQLFSSAPAYETTSSPCDELGKRRSLQSLRDAQMESSRIFDVYPFRRGKCNSLSSLRNNSSSSDITVQQGIEHDPLAKVSLNKKSSTRKMTVAEMSLWANLKKRKSIPELKPARRTTLAGWLWNRSEPEVIQPEPAPPASPEDDPVEFGYIQPATPVESPREILMRVQARHAADKEQEEDAQSSNGDKDTPSDKSFADVQHSRRSTSAFLKERFCSNTVSSSFESQSTRPTEKLSILSPKEVFSYKPTVRTPDDRRETKAADVLPQATFSEITLAPIADITEQPPVPKYLKLALSPRMIILSQEPKSSKQNLTISEITTTISQSPIAAGPDRGLVFAEVCAVIYGSMTVAAMRLAVLGMGRDIAALDLALDLGAAMTIGVGVCMVFQWFLDGSLKRGILTYTLKMCCVFFVYFVAPEGNSVGEWAMAYRLLLSVQNHN